MERPSPDPDQPIRVFLLFEQRLIAELMRLTLTCGHYTTRHATNLLDALPIIDEWHPQLAIIEMDGHGAEIVRRVGKERSGDGTVIPILALIRRGDLRTKLAAFDLGVDDILTIPISPAELLARVLGITRRSINRTARLHPVLKLGEIEIDILNHEVRTGLAVTHLTALEQCLLLLLAANAGQVVTRDEIMDALWGADFISESTVVDHHIRTLRRKLHDKGRKPPIIVTVSRQGYLFVTTPTDQL